MADHIATIRAALQRAQELGEMEMDWLGAGSDQRYADRQQREYIAKIKDGQDALEALASGVQPSDEAAIRADERERCARICEVEAEGHRTAFGEHCAAAIRKQPRPLGVKTVDGGQA